MQHLEATVLPRVGGRGLDWPASRGATPGWDIEYVDNAGRLIAVEVKGTITDSFLSFELTAQEWMQAEALRDRYWIYLVADCRTSSSPRIQTIKDPFGLMQSGA